MYYFLEKLFKGKVVSFLLVPNRRAMISHEITIAARGSAAYIAVASLLNSQFEEILLAVLVWVLLIFVAAVVAPHESKEH